MLVACGFGTNLGSSPGEPTSRRRFDSANSNGAESYDEIHNHGLSLPFDAKSGAFHLERLMRCAISLRRRTKERDDARAELLKFKVHVNLSCAVFRTSDFLCFVCSLVCLTIWCCAWRSVLPEVPFDSLHFSCLEMSACRQHLSVSPLCRAEVTSPTMSVPPCTPPLYLRRCVQPSWRWTSVALYTPPGHHTITPLPPSAAPPVLPRLLRPLCRQRQSGTGLAGAPSTSRQR